MIREKQMSAPSGLVALLLLLSLLVVLVLLIVAEAGRGLDTVVWHIIVLIAAAVVDGVCLAGLFVVNPNEAKVLQLFGHYVGTVKEPGLRWANPFYTKRFAYYVGRRCRSATVRDVARELRLDWKTVKALEMEYMREQLRRTGTPGPKVIGIDELSIGRGQNYRIVVSDLVRGRPIWFGGTDRSEKSMDLFFQWLGPRKCKAIRLAVMDMWKPFRNSTLKAGNAPQAGILYDKFHILKRLNEALDKVRKSEYARLSGKDRRFIKGQKYTLLSRRANLSQEGRQSLKALFKANRRLNKAYLLKEMFSQLWDYKREVWARRFFERWKSALRWQRLKPYERFARMVEALGRDRVALP